MSLCTHSITLSKSDFPFNTKAEINEFMDYLDGAELRFEITGDMNVGKSCKCLCEFKFKEFC